MQLRLLMETRHRLEIGQRIRELRENSTETNRSIADYCDVGERSVAAWVAGDGISYKNAKKVAELFDVDIDWLWRGQKTATPDLMGELDGSQLDRIEKKLDEMIERLEAIEAAQIVDDAEQAVDPEAPQSEVPGAEAGR